MARYLVVNPWFGVEKGQELELDELHPALVSHVEQAEESKVEAAPELEVSTPKRKTKPA